MNMLQELLKKKKIRDSQKLAKAQDKPTQTKIERPLSTVFSFLRDRQETRLGILYSLRINQVVEKLKPEPIEPKKVEVVSYVS